MWGPPKKDYKVWIVIGSNLKSNSEFFDDVELAASHHSDYGMPYENVDIFICRNPKKSIKDVWDRLKHFI